MIKGAKEENFQGAEKKTNQGAGEKGQFFSGSREQRLTLLGPHNLHTAFSIKKANIQTTILPIIMQ